MDRFADGHPDAPGTVDRADPQGWHGGDLAGLVEKVPWLADQGYGALWISPITRARTEKIGGEWGAYHGYWLLDPAAVEPRFGDLETLGALSEALHARGMRLYLDMVVNHVGYESPLIAEKPDWFHQLGDIQDWNDAEQVVTHDVHGLPDLAQENPEVAAWLTDAATHWIDTVHPDGFRIDAVRHVPPGFLATYGDAARAKAGPDFQLLGEVLDGNPARLRERAVSDRLDSLFDFPLMYGIQGSAVCGKPDHDKLAVNLFTERHLPARPDGPLLPLVTLLDNHDVPRIAAVCAHPGRALAFLYGVRGTPSVTWGTEAGLDGEHEPANRADMPWDAQMPLAATLKQLNGLRGAWPELVHGEQAILRLDADAIEVLRRTPDGPGAVVVHHRTKAPYTRAVREAWHLSDTQLEPWDGEPFEGVLLARLAEPVAIDTAPKATRVEVGPVELSEGERALVVGSAPELGAWTAAAAVPVEAGAASFTMPGGTATAAKIVVIGPGGERWSQARDVAVLAGGTARVEWE